MELVVGVRIAVIGEGMLELSRSTATNELWRLGYGGDTLNTAIHFARLGFDVAYITALGADGLSDKLRRDWQAEGLDVGHVLTDPDRLPGLYAIETDAKGERSFSYWRSDSAARQLFALEGIEAALDAAASANLLYFSLISLAILPETARAQLLRLCENVSALGVQVAFDTNYRPRLWSNAQAAQHVAAAAMARADIGLPTIGDEQMLYGAGSAEEVASRWHALGAGEVVVKLGAEGCLVSRENGEQLKVPAAQDRAVIDTSGAGDAFNAGYLGARLRGEAIEDAARSGHALAAWVVARSGAIPPIDPDAPYGR